MGESRQEGQKISLGFHLLCHDPTGYANPERICISPLSSQRELYPFVNPEGLHFHIVCPEGVPFSNLNKKAKLQNVPEMAVGTHTPSQALKVQELCGKSGVRASSYTAVEEVKREGTE